MDALTFLKNIAYWLQLYTIEIMKLYLMTRFIFGAKPRSEPQSKYIDFLQIIPIIFIILNSFFNQPVKNSQPLYIFMILFVAIKFKNVILTLFSHFLITFIDYIIGIILIWMFELNYNIAYKSTIFSAIVGFISFVILILCSILISNKRIQINQNDEYLIGNIFCFGLITCILPIVRTVFESTKLHYRGQAIVGIVLVLIMCWILYRRYLNMKREKIKYQNDILIQEQFLKEQENYYELLLEKETETRKFRHDIKQQLRCIHEYECQGEYDKSKAYIEELLNQTENFKKTISTGNKTIDIVVSDILHTSNAAIHWNGVMSSPLKMKDVEICTLFANLIKNAVEAVEQLEEKDIWVATKYFEEHLVISVKNPVKQKIEIKNNKISTSKSNIYNHGYGLSNVQDIVSKYNGTLKLDCDESYFNITVMLQDVIEN
jgi:two-component system sensor histidine kinase AgrC